MWLDPCINSSLDLSLLCGSGSGLQECVHSLKATTFVRQHQYILLGLINTSLVPRSSLLPVFDPILQVIKTWRWGRPGNKASQCKAPPHGTTICLPDVTWHHCTWDYHLSAWCYMTSLQMTRSPMSSPSVRTYRKWSNTGGREHLEMKLPWVCTIASRFFDEKWVCSGGFRNLEGGVQPLVCEVHLKFFGLPCPLLVTYIHNYWLVAS